MLGTGTFGNVYLCDGADPGQTAAVREYVPRGLAVRGEGMRVGPQSAATDARFAAGLARFVERAELMMGVEHPNVVRMRNVFQANGTACVAMDYVAGTPLSALLETGEALSADKLVAYLRPVAEGLAAMHRVGIPHGNLGLGSILIGEDGSPVLLGLAVPGRDEFGTVGAPGYAPIEHYSARAGLGSARADVYSLAAIMYRCATGVVPPEAPTRAERDTLVPALRAAQGKGYPGQLLAAIDAGLTLDPEGRPEGVGALLDVLDDSTPPSDGEPVVTAHDAGARTSARGAMPARGAGPRSGRYKVVVASAAAVLIAAFAAIFVLRGGDDGSGPEPSPVPVSEPSPDASLAETSTEVAPPPEAAEVVPETPPEPAPTRMAALAVLTRPAGAQVFLDEVPVGETPLELDGLVPGDYRIALRHPHYDDVTSELALPEGPSTFEWELVRATGALRVVTTPAGAWVESDGSRLADATPATLDGLPAGPVTLRLGTPGYVSADVDAEVPKDDTGALEFALERAFGTLTLALEPPDAEVDLLDAEVPYRPGVRLPEGRQRIAVARQGYRTVTRTLQVAGVTEHEVALVPEWHSLTVVTNPPGAAVTFVDSADAYSPGVLMPPGEYRLQAELLGYAPWTGTVRHGGAPTMHAVALEFVSAEYADPLRSGGTGPQMAVVPAGSFRMGCVAGNACAAEERPVRTVTIEAPFSLSKYEVTFEDFDRFAEAAGRERPDDQGWGRGRRPVINVSWADAEAYAEWLSAETGRSYRLPSEAEWEYAARAGGDTPYGWSDAIDGEANCDGCGRRSLRRTVLAGTFRANAWGLHDMHGNVWEWVRDCWNGSYEGAPGDGTAWTTGTCGRRVLRGGSWFNPASFARSASRLSGDAAVRGNIAGFRVAAGP